MKTTTLSRVAFSSSLSTRSAREGQFVGIGDEGAPGSKMKLWRAAPGLGQHTDEVLSELGYSSEKIQQLKGKRVVA